MKYYEALKAVEDLVAAPARLLSVENVQPVTPDEHDAKHYGLEAGKPYVFVNVRVAVPATGA